MVHYRLDLDSAFQPCTTDAGDELFSNGIFEFNISRLLTAALAHADRYPIERIELADIPDYGAAELNAAGILAADLSRPIVLAEVAPGHFNVIDGHHRVAKARRNDVSALAGYRLRCPEHVRFLTSTTAYQRYVDYWNSKVDELARVRRSMQRPRTGK